MRKKRENEKRRWKEKMKRENEKRRAGSKN